MHNCSIHYLLFLHSTGIDGARRTTFQGKVPAFSLKVGTETDFAEVHCKDRERR